MPEPRYGRAVTYPPGITPAQQRTRVAYAPGGDNEPMVAYRFADKTWDYNTEGVAHVGLFPDYYQDLKNLGMTAMERSAFFSAPEDFARMWERAEDARARVR